MRTLLLVKGMALICAGLIAVSGGLCMLVAGANGIWNLMRSDFRGLLPGLAIALLILAGCAHRDYMRESRGFCREFVGPTADGERVIAVFCTVPR